MGVCSVTKNQANKSFKYGDRIITCNVENGKDLYKTTFNSQTLVKEVKISLKKQILKNQHEKMLVKLYYKGKELKENTSTLGSIVDGNYIILVMASVPLTEEVINDEIKLDQMFIDNLTKFCEIHKDEKALLFCLSCSHSICNACEKDHVSHNYIKKIEIINYEKTLRENSMHLNTKLNEMGLQRKYSEIYKSYKQDLNIVTEKLLNVVEQIKKKESNMLNEFKTKFDTIVPGILNYKDKLDDMIYNVSEFKRGNILRNDTEFMDFYNCYSQVNSLNEKSKDNLENLRIKSEKFRNWYYEFKTRIEVILEAANINYNKIKDFQMNENILQMPYGFDASMTVKQPQEQKSKQNNKNYFPTPNYHLAKLNLINLMSSPKNGKSFVNHFEEFKKIEKIQRSKIETTRLKENQNGDIFRYDNINQNFASKSSFQEKDPNKFIVSAEASTKNIYIYDKTTKTVTKKELDMSNISLRKFEVYHSSLNYGNKFYISGGVGNTSKNFFEYDIEQNSFKKLKNMLFSHSYHSIIEIKDSIYVISGFNSKKVEKYSIESENWTCLSDLNSSRCWPICLNSDNKYLYVFSGLKEKEATSNRQIEKLDYNKNSSQWELVEFSADVNFPFYSAFLKIDHQQVYLFGGKTSKEENTNKCYSLKISDKTVNCLDNLILPNEDEFDGKELLSLDNTETKFGIFSSMFSHRFYIYDKENNSFEIIQYQSS